MSGDPNKSIELLRSFDVDELDSAQLDSDNWFTKVMARLKVDETCALCIDRGKIHASNKEGDVELSY